MKLIANNFTGVLPTGDRYKITTKDDGKAVYVYLDVDSDTGWNRLDGIFRSYGYALYPEYKEALKECLDKIEEDYQIKLYRP